MKILLFLESNILLDKLFDFQQEINEQNNITDNLTELKINEIRKKNNSDEEQSEKLINQSYFRIKDIDANFYIQHNDNKMEYKPTIENPAEERENTQNSILIK